MQSVEKLKYDKRIFISVISILLGSLIYMSVTAGYIKEENAYFKRNLDEVNRELDLLMNIMPSKDSIIEAKEQEIFRQAAIIRQELNQKEVSRKERKMLMQKLHLLKTELQELKHHVKSAALAERNIVQVNNTDEVAPVKPTADSLGESAEIAKLRARVRELEQRVPKTIIKEKLSVHYFEAIASDRKHRASRTKFFLISLQLRGDVSQVDGVQRIQVIDPENNLISDNKDVMRASNKDLSIYKFIPKNYKFIRGKYTIRIYSENSDFESRISLILN